MLSTGRVSGGAQSTRGVPSTGMLREAKPGVKSPGKPEALSIFPLTVELCV